MPPFHRLSRAFLGAILAACAVLVIDPKDKQNQATAIGIIAAAVSGGAQKRVTHRRTDTDATILNRLNQKDRRTPP